MLEAVFILVELALTRKWQGILCKSTVFPIHYKCPHIHTIVKFFMKKSYVNKLFYPKMFLPMKIQIVRLKQPKVRNNNFLLILLLKFWRVLFITLRCFSWFLWILYLLPNHLSKLGTLRHPWPLHSSHFPRFLFEFLTPDWVFQKSLQN